MISIVVPTYNRSDLIAETIESIIRQTYENWECLIVDDGSTDNTKGIVAKFLVLDSRIKFYQRPDNYKAGGNGARNYGLDNSTGDYIVFFDSDDIMTPDHLEVKFGLIEDERYDFGVTRTRFFNYTNDNLDRYYKFSTKDITKENYILQKVNWLTLDVIVKSVIARSIRFNETLKSGQEYNYFSKLVCITEKGVFKDKVVSLRRHHLNSKRTTVASGLKKHKSSAITLWYTYLETKTSVSDEVARRLLFRSYVSIIAFKSRPTDIDSLRFWLAILKHFRMNFFAKFAYYFISKFTRRFHFLRKYALRSL